MAPPELGAMEVQEQETTTGGRPRAKLALAVAGALGLLGISAAALTKPRAGQSAPTAVVDEMAEAADFTFEEFVQKYGRNYVPGSEEYARRAAIFQQSLAEIEAINAEQDNQFWRAGPNHFMDWTVEERSAMKGHNKRAKRASIKAMDADHGGQSGPPEGWTAPESGGMAKDDPRSPTIRDQGSCGSCWAFASVSAAEAYILKADTDEQYEPKDVNLAPQVLVSCVDYGCQGSNEDRPYEFIQQHGLPLEKDVPYTSGDTGEDGECVASHMGLYPGVQQLARLASWRDLPSNDDQRPLMYELLNGPVTVAVAADWRWWLYSGGVFDCAGATGIDHAVVAKGFGKQKYPLPFPLKPKFKSYWLIQNSWGKDWGEQGHIRLERTSDESQVCGMEEDDYCDDDEDCEDIKTCGACGILFDPVVPEGVTLEGTGASAHVTVV